MNEIELVLDNIARKILKEYKSNLVGTNIAKTVKYKVTNNTDKYEIIFDLEAYYINIEEGRKKGKFPNINAIRKWIDVKKILPKPSNGKAINKDQLTFLIARKIKNNGIKKRPYLAKAIKHNYNNKSVLTKISDALINTLQNDIYKQFDKVKSNR